MKKQNSYYAKPSEIQKEWVALDANGQTLGRFSSYVASLLKGKHKTNYTPSMDTGDFVVVYYAEKIAVTGKKEGQKVYYRHSGYPGGLKQRTLSYVRKNKPEDIIIHAVRGMLPKNRLGRVLITHLKVYSGEKHPHLAQEPKLMTLPVKGVSL
jgi:large subunit ribosomal protein L13